MGDDVDLVVRKLVADELPKLVRPVGHTRGSCSVRNPDPVTGGGQGVLDAREVAQYVYGPTLIRSKPSRPWTNTIGRGVEVSFHQR